MHRFYLPPEQSTGLDLTLTGPEAHHALHVLRIKPGDKVTLLDGHGTCIQTQVTHCSRDSVKLTALDRTLTEPPTHKITLLQAVTKAKALELVIQKATELGVWRIVPLITARVTPQLCTEHAPSKLLKWQRIAIEAIKQSGNPWLPKIEAPVSVSDVIKNNQRFELELVASLQRNPAHPKKCLANYVTLHGKMPTTICVWIGPEGDFTPDELQAIISHGAQPITLGRYILRAETAAIYCLSILHYELTAPSVTCTES